MQFRRFRPSPALVVAMIALFVGLSGAGYAAFTLPKNSVTSINVKDFSLLAKDFKPGQIPAGPAGPAGAAGPAGPPGPAGAQGPAGAGGTANVKWAVFRKDGGIAVQSGGITLASKPSAGQYLVNFGSAINGKLIIVSNSYASSDQTVHGAPVATPCGNPTEGITCSVSNDTNTVLVHTTSGSGSLEDHSFYVAVFG
jgi:hypothetical protein